MGKKEADGMNVDINISPDILRNMSDLEMLTAELVESLDQAVKDNVIDKNQAREAVQIARETMERILSAKKDV